MEESEGEVDQQYDGPDLSQLPESYALNDLQKTERIKELEREVVLLDRHLVETRNQLNTALSEVDKYKRVHVQVSWLLEQFKNTLSGVYDKPKLEAILPPPPPSLVLALPPPPLSPKSVKKESKAVTEPLTIDLTSPASSQGLLDKENEEDKENEVDQENEGDEEDEYSDDWETLEETTASDSTVSMAEPDPSPPDLSTLLINVNRKTHISEIFRRLNPS